MGMFSWTCAVCTHDLLGDSVAGYRKYNEAKLLLPNGDILTGSYSGYGELAGLDLSERKGFKLVHLACWEPGMHYEGLGETEHARDQGFFPGERLCEEQWGPPNMEEIEHETEYVCLECRRVFKSKWSHGKCPYGCPGPKPCHEHGVSTVMASLEVYRKNWAQDTRTRKRIEKRLIEEEGLSEGDARNATFSAPYDAELRAEREKLQCKKCEAVSDNTVEQLEHDADALVVCRNPSYTIREGQTTPRPCWSYGKTVQAQSKPRSWETDYVPKCSSCSSPDHLEFFELIKAPLQHLAMEAE